MSARPRRALELLNLETRTVPAGGLDTTFSGDGLATIGLTTQTQTSEQGWDQVVQPDGKILVVGNVDSAGNNNNWAVYRYNPDGTLDTTFGASGVATGDFGSSFEQAFDIALQADGKIVITGSAQNPAIGISAFAAARLTTTGQLDPTFDGDGKVLTTILTDPLGLPRVCESRGVAIQADGKIVLAGYTFTAGLEEFAVARYLSNGSLDPGFGNAGVRAFGTFQSDFANAVAIQPDGKIVVGGTSFFSFNPDFALGRLNANGSVDTAFGTMGNGVVIDTFPFGPGGGDERINDLLIAPGGAILAAGECIPINFYRDFALARYNPDGSPDTTFGKDYNGDDIKDGKLNTEFGFGQFGGETSEIAHNVALQADGKIVAAGEWFDGFTSDFALARYLTDGTLDNTFGRLDGTQPSGKQLVDFGSADDDGEGVSVVTVGGQSKIVVSGQTDNNKGDIAVARLNANGTLDDAFGDGGRVSTNYGLIDLPNDDVGHAVVVQPDGKVIVGGRTGAGGFGDFGLARFNRDGTVDTSFGNNGTIQTEMGVFDSLNALLLQPNGRILAAGETNDGFGLARYSADGNLDTSFDGDGKVITELGDFQADGATAAALMANGKIVLAGYSGFDGTLGLVRYLPNGQLDLTLDFDGKLTDPGFGGTPVAVVVQPDGKILVANAGSISRYLPGGRLDATFGIGGRATPNLGADSAITGLALRPDGRIVVAGRGANPIGPEQTDNFAVTQLLSNGLPDFAFGGGTFVLTDFGGRTDQANAVRLQADGKIILAGTSRQGGEVQYALARYLTNGNLDPTFGVGGRVTGSVGSESDVTALDLQANGKIDVAGSVGPLGSQDFFALQFRGDNTPPTTTGIADFTVNEDAPERTYDLRTLFDDAQDTDLELEFSVQNTNPGIISATIDSNDILKVVFLPNKYGTATITVRATDLDGGFIDEPFTVTVNSVNDVPVAVNDEVSTNDQTPVTVDVLANDSDADTGNPAPDTDFLTLVSVTAASKGTARIENNKVVWSPRSNVHGDEVLTYTVKDNFGATATATLTIHVTDITRPVAREVRLYYAPRRYEILTDRATVFGWSNIRKVEVVFSENVSVQQNDLFLTGLAGAYTFSGFAYNATTFTATWTLAQPIGIDRLNFTLDGTSPTGVVDATAGNNLGADVVRRFGVLPGDLDGNGIVTLTEATTVKKNIGKRYPSPRTVDINGDGTVTNADYLIAKANVGKRI
jgi:uncharacterized delta-60 repeat protein